MNGTDVQWEVIHYYYYIVLYCIVLYYIILYYIILYYTILYYTILYYIILYYIILYYIILYYIILYYKLHQLISHKFSNLNKFCQPEALILYFETTNNSFCISKNIVRGILLSNFQLNEQCLQDGTELYSKGNQITFRYASPSFRIQGTISLITL